MASCNKHSLCTDLSRVLFFVCNFTRRTVPLESGRVCTILPMIQVLRGDELSTTSTTSPGSKFLFCLVHFWRSWRRGRYSRVHLRQKRSARYYTCLQRFFVAYRSSWLKIPGGRLGWVFINNRWLGVRGSNSCGSSDTLVMGRPFIMLSTSQRSV